MYQFRRSILAFSFVGILNPVIANANDCGKDSQDYTADRTLHIGDDVRKLKVYVSGSKIREERNINEQEKIITLRLPEQGVNYIFIPTKGDGYKLRYPPKPPPLKQKTKQTTEKQSDGTTIRRLMVFNNNEWQTISSTVCNSDNIMLTQTFILVDAKGDPMNGSLIQSNIKIEHLSNDLFEVPSNVKITE